MSVVRHRVCGTGRVVRVAFSHGGYPLQNDGTAEPLAQSAINATLPVHVVLVFQNAVKDGLRSVRVVGQTSLSCQAAMGDTQTEGQHGVGV